ncbi:MAG TPA: class I SAM-dependent methyltransferase [Myxococcota bacterium]|nr:class I SAM-dependent methyltransferase [Myxococcota bacterium]
MRSVAHRSAKASHYNQDAKHYDAFNEENSRVINRALESILKKHKVKTVLDVTCGTGSQVFWLTHAGFDVVGGDINACMLAIAKKKAAEQELAVKFVKGDMRKLKVGKFGAVIAIFNAIGHLTINDFAKTIRNVAHNLNDNGLFIFDIFDADYLRHKDNITKFTIDCLKTTDDVTARVIQYSTIDDNGIMASFTTAYEQKTSQKPKMTTSAQTLQVYSASELRDLLNNNGFKVVKLCAIDGSKFMPLRTDRILTIARKK